MRPQTLHKSPRIPTDHCRFWLRRYGVGLKLCISFLHLFAETEPRGRDTTYCLGRDPSQFIEGLSHVQLIATQWTAAHQASLSITNSWSSLKLIPIESVMPSNNLIICHPHLLLPSIFPASGSYPMSRFFTSVQFSSVA